MAFTKSFMATTACVGALSLMMSPAFATAEVLKGRPAQSKDTQPSTTEATTEAGVNAPSTVSCRQCNRPDYPEEALTAGVEGAPEIRMEYDEMGRVTDVTLERSSGNVALDQAALEAASGYLLETGGRSGAVSIEINFVIDFENERSQREQRAQQHNEEAITASDRASDLALALETMLVRIEYDEGGTVIDAVIEQPSGNAEIDAAALAAAHSMANAPTSAPIGEATSLTIEVVPDDIRKARLRMLMDPLERQ